MDTPEEFWACVRISSRPRRCWPWKRPLPPGKYPQVQYQGKQWRANRLALTLAKGPIPDGLWALHDCSPGGNNDDPTCCNPAHLYAGTAADNHIDSITRGFGHFRFGERNFNGKLTDEQVEWARSQRGILTQADIAAQLGCSRVHVCNIQLGNRR